MAKDENDLAVFEGLLLYYVFLISMSQFKQFFIFQQKQSFYGSMMFLENYQKNKDKICPRPLCIGLTVLTLMCTRTAAAKSLSGLTALFEFYFSWC